MTYLIEFPIGDWSKDGHGMCDTFFTYSNKTVEELRECHYNFKDIFGFCIGSLCSEHGDSYLSAEQYLQLERITTIPLKLLESIKEDEYYISDPETLFLIWKFCLQAVDPSIIFEEAISNSMVFGGYDDKKRHVYSPGYGLYE